MKTIRFCTLLLVLLGIAVRPDARAANIVWVSDNPNTNAAGVVTNVFAGPINGTPDDSFVTVLQAAGHNVIRFSSSDSQNFLLQPADINALNTNDLLILGRSISSAAFQAPQGHQWNTNITKPLICQNAYLIRNSRLGWFTGSDDTPDGVPVPLTAANLVDPEIAYLFGGVAMNGSTMAGDFDIAFGRNISHVNPTNLPVAGARVLATFGTTNVMVDFPAGTVVKGGANVLAGYRLYIASGNREPSGGSIAGTAGTNNLTADGQNIFMRAVTLALNSGNSGLIGDPPTITTQPANVAACSGLPASFNVVADGEIPLSYQWYHSDGSTFTNPVAGGTGATLTIPNVQATNVGFYAVVITNVNGSITSSIVSLTIVGAGVAATGPASQTNCPGSTAVFTTTATGSGTITYTWRKAGAVVQGPDGNNTYTIASVVAGDAGAYSVTVSNDCNSVSNNFTFTVVSAPTISAHPQNQTTPVGNGAVFSVTATGFGTAPNTYQWTTNGVDVTGANGSTFAISNLTLAASGMQVQVAVSNCAGGLLSSIATLTVTPVSGVTFDFNSPNQFTNVPYYMTYNDWISSAFVGTVLGTFENPIGGVGPFPGSGSLDQFPNRGTGTGFGSGSHIVVPLAYDFSLAGKRLNASVMIKVKTPLRNAADRSTQIGFTTSTNSDLNNNAGFSYMSVIMQQTVASVPTYDLRQGTKPNAASTFFEGNSATATPLTVSNWYQLTATFVNSNDVRAGTYTVAGSLRDMGPLGTVPGSVVMSFGPVTITNVDVTSARYLYFVLRGSDNTGMEAWDNVEVSSATGPIAFVQQPGNQTAAQGDRVTFRARVDGDGPYTYQWNTNGVAIAGATSWKYVTPPTRTSDNGVQYTVTVTGPGNSVTSDPATLTVTADTLAVVSAGSVDGTTVGVQFNQPVDPATAENPANYTINGVAPVQARVYRTSLSPLGPQGIYVVLTPASVLSGAFTVVASGVQDLSGGTVGGANSASGNVAGLTGSDINAITGPPGENYSFGDGQFIITAGGVDIWNNADSFRFVYTTQTGDFDVKTKVPYIDVVRGASKAGIQVRESLDPFTREITAAINPMWPGRNFSEGINRATWNIPSTSWGASPTYNFAWYPDAWLRFRRVGNTFLRYSSTNGVNWNFDGQISASPMLPDTLYFGLAVCSVANLNALSAQYENYGPFAGYSGATIAIVSQPTNFTVAAGASFTDGVVATVSGGGIPASAGELAYVWQRNDGSGTFTNLVTSGATNNTVGIGPLFFSDNGAQFRVVLKAPGAADVISSTFTATVTDSAVPTIASVNGTYSMYPVSEVVVNFSELVSDVTGTNVANYTVTNAAGVRLTVLNAVFLSGDRRTVVLTVDGQLGLGNGSVGVSGVRDLNNNLLATAVRTFRTFAPGSGPVVVEYYQDIGGGQDTSVLTAHAFYTAGQPTWISYSNLFGVNVGINAGLFPGVTFSGGTVAEDNMGVKAYTYFIPPTNGQYKFWMRSDDFTVLSMNTNAVGSTNPAGKVTIATNLLVSANYTMAGGVLLGTTNITLVAGQAYYMEVLMKEGGGSDGFSVMWTAPTVTTAPAATAFIPTANLAFPSAAASPAPVITELYLGYQPAIAGNGNLPTLTAATNFPTGAASNNFAVNAEISTLPNWKYIAGLPDMVGYQRYFGTQPQLTGNTRVDNYLGRMLTYFVAPSNGNYRFYLRADDAAQFYMNTNAANSTDAAGLRLIGRVDAFTSAYTLVGQNMSLVGGQRYLMVVLWREGGGGDGVAMAVRSQGDAAIPPIGPPPETIPGSMLEYPLAYGRAGAVNFTGILPGGPFVEGQSITLTPAGVTGSMMSGAGNHANGGPGYGFIWLRNGVRVMENSFTNILPRPLTLADNGAVYTLIITNQFSSAERSITLSVAADTTAPTVVRTVGWRYGDGFTIQFSERLDPTSATFLGNYSVNNGLDLLSATLDVSGTMVSIRTAPQAPATTYTVTISGVKDVSAAGNAASTMTSFSTWSVGGSGVMVELFTNIVGGTIADLTGSPKFVANLPDVVYYTNNFFAGGNNNLGDSGRENYGARLTAYFVPTNTGYFRFYVRSDDASQLWMNINSANSEDPAGRIMLIHMPNAGVSMQDPLSMSPPVLLNQGQRYYMEGLFKEGTGGDYFLMTFRATDANGTSVTGVPVDTVAEIQGAGNFNGVPGNPDAIQIVSTPPTDVTVVENDPVTLTLVANVPLSMALATSYQWQRFDGASFTNIPGATGPSYSFFAPLSDDNRQIRLVFSAPGRNTAFTTLMHVTADVTPPVMVAANSLGGTSIGICYSEPVDPNSAADPSNYFINGDPSFTPIAAVVRTNIDPRTVILTLSGPGVPISGTFTVENLGVGDLAASQNFGISSVTGAVQNLVPMDVGAPPGVGSTFSCTNNEMDIVAGGADIWGASDQGHMVLGTRSGNFDIWAQIASLSRAPGDNDGITKAGIMVRETWDANARKITYLAEPPAAVGGRDIVEASHRITVNGATAALAGGNGNVGGPANIPNVWLRIKRVGQDFTTYRSSNGVDWIQTSTDALGFSNTVYVGLAATAHIPSPSAATTLAKIRNVHVPDPPTITVQPTPADQTIPLHGSVSYSVAATNPPNSGALTYQWYRGSAAVPGATGSTLNIADLSGADTGLYTVRVGNDGGQVDSVPVNLVVSNAMIVVTNDSLSVTQGNVLVIPAASLAGNDFDPEAQALSVIAVSGLQPASFVADFNSGVPAGIQLLGTAIVDTTGGVENSGVLKLTTAVGSQGGGMVISNLSPLRAVTAFDARFKVLITGGSGNPADGFSFSFSSAPGLVGEEGTGTGLVVAFDNYDNGGGEAPAIDLKWNNATLATTRVPKIQSSVYLDVAVRLYTDGKVDVSFGGSNVYSGFQTPYTPISGSFVFGGRTGGEFEAHWIDDISITTILTRETSREPTQAPLNGTLYGSAYVGQDVLHITDAANSQDGGYAINNLSPGSAVTAFTATMGVQIGSGSADGADGMSFNLASDLPLGLGGASEDGVGTGLSICIDNYSGGTLPAGPAIRVKYAGTFIASVQVPKWNNPAFIPVSITLDADGTVDVVVNGTNVFTDLATPYAPINGRFGIYGRTGGLNQRHWVDNLVINATTTGGPASFSTDFNSSGYGTVALNAGVVTYTPPAVACGTDSFYYLVTDSLGDTKLGRVDVSLTETNPQPPVILACVPDQTVVGYTNSQVALPDLRSQLLALDSCGAVTITQNPPPGTLLNDGTTNVVTFTVTDVTGSNAVCQASIIIRVDEPSFIPGTAVFTQPTGPFSAQFQTVNGVNYRIEYTDSLNAPITWNLLTTVVGDGTVKTISDPGPLPPMRYYRIVPTP